MGQHQHQLRLQLIKRYVVKIYRYRYEAAANGMQCGNRRGFDSRQPRGSRDNPFTRPTAQQSIICQYSNNRTVNVNGLCEVWYVGVWFVCL